MPGVERDGKGWEGSGVACCAYQVLTPYGRAARRSPFAPLCMVPPTRGFTQRRTRLTWLGGCLAPAVGGQLECGGGREGGLREKLGKKK